MAEAHDAPAGADHGAQARLRLGRQRTAAGVRARARSSNTMSSAGPGAPPCSGPFSAPMAPTTAEQMSDCVLTITRAAKVEAFMPWSTTVLQ